MIAARSVYCACGVRFSSATLSAIWPLRTEVSDLDIADPGARRCADEVDVAAQPPPLDLADAPPGRVRVVEHEHDFPERPGDDPQAENVLASRLADAM